MSAKELEHAKTTTAGTQTTGSTSTTASQYREGELDGDGYEHHYAATTNAVVRGSDLHGNVLQGISSADTLVGGAQDDVINGGDGDNILQGGGGTDIMVAGTSSAHGHNHLDGGSGDDVLVAGGAKTRYMDDFLVQHQDVANAVRGDAKYADLASIQSGVVSNVGTAENVFEMHSGNGRDLIFNFHANADKLQIDRGLNGSNIQDIQTLVQHIVVSGNDVAFDLGNGNSVTLVGVDVTALTAANIVLV